MRSLYLPPDDRHAVLAALLALPAPPHPCYTLGDLNFQVEEFPAAQFEWLSGFQLSGR